MEYKTKLFFFWYIMNFIDFLTTVYALNFAGFIENNPLYYLNPTVYWLIKLVGVPLLIYALHRRIKTVALYLCIIFYSGILLNNFYEIFNFLLR